MLTFIRSTILRKSSGLLNLFQPSCNPLHHGYAAIYVNMLSSPATIRWFGSSSRRLPSTSNGFRAVGATRRRAKPVIVDTDHNPAPRVAATNEFEDLSFLMVKPHVSQPKTQDRLLTMDDLEPGFKPKRSNNRNNYSRDTNNFHRNFDDNHYDRHRNYGDHQKLGERSHFNSERQDRQSNRIQYKNDERKSKEFDGRRQFGKPLQNIETPPPRSKLFSAMDNLKANKENKLLIQGLATQIERLSDAEWNTSTFAKIFLVVKDVVNDDPATHRLVTTIAEKITTTAVLFDDRIISNVFMWIQALDSAHDSTHKLVDAMASKLSISESLALSFHTIKSMSQAMLQLNPNEISTQKLVDVMADKIMSSPAVPDLALYHTMVKCIADMPPNEPSTKKFVNAMAKKLADSPNKSNDMILDAPLIVSMCQLLMHLQPRDASTKALVYALAKKLPKSDAKFNAVEVGKVFQGLQMLDCNLEGSRMLIKALTFKIDTSEFVLEHTDILSCLDCIKCLDVTTGKTPDVSSVYKLIGVLSKKIQRSTAIFDGHIISESCYCLNRLDSGEQGTKRLVEALAVKVAQSTAILTSEQMNKACYGLRHLSSHDVSTKKLANALATKISRSNNQQEPTVEYLSNLFNVLPFMDQHTTSTRMMVVSLTMMLEDSDKVLDAATLSNACCSLRNLDGQDTSTKMLADALAVQLLDKQNDLQFTAQQIGDACYGLQNLDPNSSGTRKLCKALTNAILQSLSKDHFTGHSIAFACYGLNNLNGTSGSTKQLVDALAKKIKATSDATLKSNHIGLSLYGLKNLDGQDDSTKSLVFALMKKLTQSMDTALESQAIGQACFGLQNLDGNDVNTSRLVKHLSIMIAKSDAKIDATSISLGCFGLQNLNGQDENTHLLVDVLAHKISKSEDTLTVDQIGQALYGLQNLAGNHKSTKKLVEALVQKINSSQVTGQLTPLVIGQVLEGIKGLGEKDRRSILVATGITTAHGYLRSVEANCANEEEVKRMYSQYLSYVLTTDPERGMKELEIMINESKISTLTELQSEDLYSEICIDCTNHTPTTAVALLAYYFIQSTKQYKNKQNWRIIMHQPGTSMNLEQRKLRSIVEAWLQSQEYVVSSSQGMLIVQMK